MYDTNLSSEIFNQLMNGKVINKNILNNNAQFIENPLFNKAMDNLGDYRTQYEMNGMEFVEKAEYIFIKDKFSNQDDLKTDITMKACLLLSLLNHLEVLPKLILKLFKKCQIPKRLWIRQI